MNGKKTFLSFSLCRNHLLVWLYPLVGLALDVSAFAGTTVVAGFLSSFFDFCAKDGTSPMKTPRANPQTCFTSKLFYHRYYRIKGVS